MPDIRGMRGNLLEDFQQIPPMTALEDLDEWGERWWWYSVGGRGGGGWSEGRGCIEGRERLGSGLGVE